ncbi:hypothetical protein UFOVP1040_70 [uncultured Caudovirales phage]|uniref:Uncharacterized protein n=1 Tax=uncultured Caudovirales phage TaxID=2100421 RepID=A0A6J5QDS8_9CAUD|nr:hypothetical protein UFOVP1040_70 [uncultured Caudovirales phage]
MADWNKPTTTSNYSTEFIPELSNRLLDVAKGNDPAIVTVSNVPTNMIRWTSASSKWEKYNGSAWADLAATYAIAISGNAGTASAWATGRTIDLTGDVTGTSGAWTGSANISFATTLATVTAAKGGTGQSGGYAVGDILYASGAAALSKLAGVATGNALISGGVTTAPAWGKIALTTHVSGQLPVANGGTAGNDAATARTNLSATGRASPSAGLDSSVIAYDNRALTNPLTGLAYFAGMRVRHGAMNEDSASPFADVIDLSTFNSSSNGGFNALYLNKASQQIKHKWAAAGGTSWTVREVAYLDSPTFTGTPAAPTATVDTNTTQLATTAYVVGQGYLKSGSSGTAGGTLWNPTQGSQTLTWSAGGTSAWDANLGQIASIVASGGNTTMGAPTNLKVGHYVLKFTQGSPARTITWNTIYQWDAGLEPVLSTGNGEVDILSFFYDGSKMHGGLFVRGSAP